MKGVIVQVGEPKSIVLFNNGRISAIQTPTECHVGMVVSVKFNDKLKIAIFALAAVLLLIIGILIGIYFFGGKKNNIPPVPAPPMMDDRFHHMRERRNNMMRRMNDILNDPVI